MKNLLLSQFPRSNQYDPDWIRHHEMGPNVLWLTEALTQVMTLQPGMRVLDLGCGKALSSIFLAREFGVQVWATDLWIEATDNLTRIRELGLEDRVFPIHADARALPYAADFFDAVISLDSFHYFGTDVHYLDEHLLPLLKSGGQLGVISPASPQPLPYPLPEHLSPDWHWLNSLDWWCDRWRRQPGLTMTHGDMLPNGWDLWVQWNEFLFNGEFRNSHNTETERDLVLTDGGEYLGFVRLVGVADGL